MLNPIPANVKNNSLCIAKASFFHFNPIYYDSRKWAAVIFSWVIKQSFVPMKKWAKNIDSMS